MSNLTPQIDRILDELAELCHQALQGNEPMPEDRIVQILRSLSQNGWDRHTTHAVPLSVQLYRRVLERLDHPMIEHRARLTGLTTRVEKIYQRESKFSSSMPPSERPISQREDLAPRPPRGAPR